jgi:hypothetical protein
MISRHVSELLHRLVVVVVNPYRILSPAHVGNHFNHNDAVCGFGRTVTVQDLEDQEQQQSKISIDRVLYV